MLRVNKILRNLEISLDQLKELVAHLDMDVSRPTSILTQEEVNKINLLYLASKSEDKEAKVRVESNKGVSHISSRNRGKKVISEIKLGPNMYDLGTTVLFIATVQWYYNHSNGGEYGFLSNSELGDIHFKGSIVKGVNPRTLTEGQSVVVTAEKHNINRDRGRKLSRVNLIEDEVNIDFLVFALRQFVNSTQRVTSILKALKDNSDLLLDSHKDLLLELSNKLESEEIKSKNNLFIRLQVANITGVAFNYDEVSENELFSLWKSGTDIGDTSRISDRIVQFFTGNMRALIMPCFDVLSVQDKNDLLERLLEDCIVENSAYLKANLKAILDTARKYEITLSFDDYSDQVKFKLWRLGFKVDTSLPHFLNHVAQSYNELDSSRIERFDTVISKNEDLFKRLSHQEVIDLFALVHFSSDKVNKESVYLLFILLASFPINEEIKEKVVESFYSKSSSYYKLRLFVDDLVDVVDFDDAALYTGLLSKDEQKLFLKKVAYLKSRGFQDISIADLDRILVTDYPTSKIAEELDGSKKDYSVSVIIHILKELKIGGTPTLSGIFQYVANIINAPKDIIRITGFFDKCEGRTLLRAEEYVDDNDELSRKYVKEIVEKLKPRFSIYCDGKKAFNTDNTPALSQKEGREFYWCENTPCFETCRNFHEPEDWKNYSLKDLLRIFDISCDEESYSELIGVLNKCNRYFEHLNCRSCGEILHPTGKENYGFYRVSNFSCTNSDCLEPDENIYLSHCANGACPDLIDSRDTVKCKPAGFGENCGWYICNYCFACCGTSKLLQRKNNLEYLGRSYQCHTQGHKDKQEICCNKCGEVMVENEVMGALYEKQLQWFIDNKAAHPNIGSSNQRSDEKWWFKWEIGNLDFDAYRSQLKNLLINGFQIPDYSDETNVSQLVSEPFKNIKGVSNYKCGCGNELILNNDKDMDAHRRMAIIKYHKKQVQ